MRKTLRLFTLSLCFLLSIGAHAASIKGIIVDKNSNESLIGASIVLKGTTIGTVTTYNGSFELTNVKKGKYTVLFHYIGFADLEKEVSVNSSDQIIDLGTVKMESDAVGLNEVKVMASIAVDRKTPIAVSNIKPEKITQKLGTQEFPEILKSTPGIYATKRGGGFGDADVRIRGFSSNNVAVLINGMPVNGMEDDKVYWSNWAGLSDVTQTMQVQRGVGASKIAVPSVGGTINVLTKTTQAKQGGRVFYTHGNDGFHKYGANFSTGLNENNWAASVSLSRTVGNGYVYGTPFSAYSYFLNVSKKINDKHSLAFTFFGAPQSHAKRYTYQDVSILSEKKDGHRFNDDYGYKNGQFYSNSTNFYNKPVAMLNHFWEINKLTYLSTSVYASSGSGGGGYATEGDVQITRNSEGLMDWDQVMEDNAEYVKQGKGSGIFFQNSYNNHDWYGALSTFKKDLGLIKLLAGADLRYYYGEHYQQADDLFGADFVIDRRNRNAVNFYNTTVRQGEIINYHNDGEVMWEGAFAQAEYSTDELSTFASVTLSNRSYRRYDFAQYFSDDEKTALDNDPALQMQYEKKLQEYMEAGNYNSIFETKAYKINQRTEWQHFLGYSFKAGANYNLNDKHNVFANGGYMERQPIFSAVFQDYQNIINTEAVNEKVLSGEIGYGYRSQYFSGNLNMYYTYWRDKTRTGNVPDPEDRENRLFYNVQGINARHMGIEFDGVIKPTEKLEVTVMASLGDWIWANNVDTVKIYKEQELIDEIPQMYIKGVHVADAAQTTAAIGINYNLWGGLKVGADVNYYDRVFADFDLNSRTKPSDEGTDAEKIPDYLLLDFNMYYKFKMGDLDASIYSNFHNLLNTIYIADAVEGRGYYFGYGRTWSFGMKILF